MKLVKQRFGSSGGGDIRALARLRADGPWMGAAVLDAVQEGILLLDTNGRLLLANDAWRQGASSHALLDSGCAIGEDYLYRCEELAHGDVADVQAVVTGIRAVLNGSTKRFSFEFDDTSSAVARRFLLIATPVGGELSGGAIVVHVDVTQRRQDDEVFQHFGTTMGSAAEAIYVVDRASMRFIYVNAAACALKGMSRGRLMALRPEHALFTPRAELELAYDLLIQTGIGGEPVELRRRLTDGSIRWTEARRQALLVKNAWAIVTFARDITRSKQAEQRVEYLNRVHAMLSGINTLLTHARSRDDLLQAACRIAIADGGFRLAVVGSMDTGERSITPVAYAADDDVVLAGVKAILAARHGAITAISGAAISGKIGVASNDTKMDRDIPSRFALAKFGIRSMAVFPLKIADKVVGVIAFYARERHFFHAEEMKLLTELTGDIAFALDYVEKQDRLNYLALYDPLTGLANRTLFLERVAQYMRAATHHGHRLALILMDVERFKNVNDSLGRAAGDVLIRSVGKWLQSNVGDPSHMARLDADKFAIVVPEIGAAGDVARMLEGMLGQLAAHPFELSGVALRVSAKAGIALFEDESGDVETLFINAEAALKKAKAAGNRYLFYAQRMTEAAIKRLQVENRLRQALENGRFVLHYQPKLDLLSRRITGVEALIRWNDPEGGLVQPKDFVPFLEESGLIQAVGLWALETAVADYVRWRRMGLEAPRIAVNVSPLQLRDPDFVAHITRALELEPHASEGLELELTESVIMEDIERSRTCLEAIRALGVKIAIDDFGTGFSSLSYLVKLPVHTLKIDRSFIVELANGQEGIVLNTMIINLAHSLKMNVVGEGVETPEQELALRSLGCDEIQGYYFSEPLPVDVLEARFLTRRRAR